MDLNGMPFSLWFNLWLMVPPPLMASLSFGQLWLWELCLGPLVALFWWWWRNRGNSAVGYVPAETESWLDRAFLPPDLPEVAKVPHAPPLPDLQNLIALPRPESMPPGERIAVAVRLEPLFLTTPMAPRGTEIMANPNRWERSPQTVPQTLVQDAIAPSPPESGAIPREGGEPPQGSLPSWEVFPKMNLTTVQVNALGEILQERTIAVPYHREPLPWNTALTFLAIPGGHFFMGTSPQERGSWRDEHPCHGVHLNPFWLAQTPLTYGQLEAIATLPTIQHPLTCYPSGHPGDDHPVGAIPWLEALEICDRLSLYLGQTFRLPSEAEWEYACRAGSNTPFHFGATLTSALANYNSTHPYGQEKSGGYRGGTTPVASFPPNAFGLYDMHGNVTEWCGDLWHRDYQGAPTQGEAWNETKGAIAGRIVRGGSWSHRPKDCRSGSRLALMAGSDPWIAGLRLVWVPGEEKSR